MDDTVVDKWEDVVLFPLIFTIFFLGIIAQLPFENIILIVLMLLLVKIEYNTQRMRGFLKQK